MTATSRRPGAGGLSLYAVAPCRVIDTRHVGNGQPFTGTLTPPVDVVHSPCGPPATAQAYVFNATVIPPGSLGYLTLWPDGAPTSPWSRRLNAADGSLTNNMAIVPTTQRKGRCLCVGAHATDPRHLQLLRAIGPEEENGCRPESDRQLVQKSLLGSWCHNSDILPKLALVHSFFSSCGGLRFLRMDSPRISMRWAL